MGKRLEVKLHFKYLILAAALLTAPSVMAQEEKPEPPYRFEFGVSISGYPTFALDYYKKGVFTIGAYHWIDGHQDDYFSYIYGDHRGPIHCTGNIQFEGSVYLEPWLVQSLNVGFIQFWNPRIDNASGAKEGEDYGIGISLMPELKLIANRRHAVRFFCSLAVGTSFYMGSGFENMRSHDKHPSAVHQRLELEWVPVGIIIGRKFNFYANFGIGTAYMGGRTGLTYRF